MRLLPFPDFFAAAIAICLLSPQALLAQALVTIRAQDLNGKTHIGGLVEISAQQVRMAGESPEDLKKSDVLRIDWRPSPETLLENGPQVLLANGDRLGLRPLAMNEESLRGTWESFPAWPEIEIPLETVRGVLLSPPRNRLDRAQMIARVRDQKETQDYFYLSNGDHLPGQLEGYSDGAFQLKTATGKVSLSAATVRAYGLNPELTSFPATKGEVALLALTDGSLLTVTDVRYDGKAGLHCQAACGPKFNLPTEQLVSLQFLGDRIVYLSELQPEQFTSTPYLSKSWPWRRNQNVLGGPLRLGPREYARGIGMHSQALATYSLNGKYLSFQAVIGIDGVTEGQGSVIFRILTDGKPVFTSDVVRGKTPPISIAPLNLQGVQKLTLVVDFADHGDILDHADWCDTVLIKAP